MKDLTLHHARDIMLQELSPIYNTAYHGKYEPISIEASINLRVDSIIFKLKSIGISFDDKEDINDGTKTS